MNDNQDILYRLALQPGTTKTQDGKTYVLNENHRWTLPREKDSPGQTFMFDAQDDQAFDEELTFDFKMNLPETKGTDRDFVEYQIARDQRLADAIEKVRKIPGEAGKRAQAKVVSAQIEKIFDDIENLAAGRVPRGYDQKQFMKFKLFNGLDIELTGEPTDWSNSTADLSQLDGLPPHVIKSFKERRKRREQGIVRRMAVAANNLKTLIDPSKKQTLDSGFAIEGLNRIKFNPKNSVLTDGANGYFSAHFKQIGIVISNCYDSMFAPGKSKAPGFQELQDFFSNITPEGIVIHELAHAINCDNLYKSGLAFFGDRQEVTQFWSDWSKTFMSWPFRANLKKMTDAGDEEKFTEQLQKAFPAIKKEWDEWAYRVNEDFIEFWDEQISLESEDVSEYATTCPAELVAEMFASPKPMNEFPKNLQTYYKLAGGPDFELSNHKRSSGNAT